MLMTSMVMSSPGNPVSLERYSHLGVTVALMGQNVWYIATVLGMEANPVHCSSGRISCSRIRQDHY
jgi:hypothetical protein